MTLPVVSFLGAAGAAVLVHAYRARPRGADGTDCRDLGRGRDTDLNAAFAKPFTNRPASGAVRRRRPSEGKIKAIVARSSRLDRARRRLCRGALANAGLLTSSLQESERDRDGAFALGTHRWYTIPSCCLHARPIRNAHR